MFEQAAFPVQNAESVETLSARIEFACAANRADLFLASVAAKKLRIRQFEQILAKGLLGKESEGLYKGLAMSDQALVRERYLARIERIPAELRQRFLKLFAYY